MLFPVYQLTKSISTAAAWKTPLGMGLGRLAQARVSLKTPQLHLFAPGLEKLNPRSLILAQNLPNRRTLAAVNTRQG